MDIRWFAFNQEKIVLPEFAKDLNFSDMVGKREDEAREFFEDNNMAMRVTERNGKEIMCTCDFRIDRINVAVEYGLIKMIVSRG